MKKTLFILCIFSMVVFSLPLDAWLDYQTGGDSLSPNIGKINVGGRIEGTNWTLLLSEEYVDTDSTSLSPRFITSYSQTDIDFTIDLGPIVLNPALRFNMFLGDNADVVLPNAEGVAARTKYMRPGLDIEGYFSDAITFQTGGMLWIGNLQSEPDAITSATPSSEGEFKRTRYALNAGASWESSGGLTIGISGEYHHSNSERIDWNSEWSRIDCSAMYSPENLMRWAYMTAGLKYSFYNGEDYLGNDIADRLTAGLRASKTIFPSFAINGTVEASVDFDGNITRFASSYGEVRAIYHFWRNRIIPSNVTASAQISSYATQSARITLSSKINLYNGLSLLLNGEARETPTSVPGASERRQRVSYGPGLEYKMGTTLRVWGLIEEQRTNLEEVEVWLRVRAGLEYYFFGEE